MKYKKNGTGYKSECGRFEIRHTGTQGRSTRLFTAYMNGEQVGTQGGLLAVKKQVESFRC